MKFFHCAFVIFFYGKVAVVSLISVIFLILAD